MSIINSSDLTKLVIDFNNSYFLTYSYTLQPNYLKYSSQSFVFSYETKDFLKTINYLYNSLFSEKTSIIYEIKMESLSYLDNILNIEFTYYFPRNIKKKDYDYLIYNFTLNLELSLNKFQEIYLNQYIVSSIKLDDISKDSIINNNARLEGRLEKSLYRNENIFDFIINFFKDQLRERFHHLFYTIQTKTSSLLIWSIECDNADYLSILESIIKQSFLNSKNLIFYEPLIILENSSIYNSTLEFLQIYQLLEINNINVKIRFLVYNNSMLVFIERLGIKQLNKKDIIINIINNRNKQEETPFALIFPSYIEDEYSELYKIFLKYNREFLENFYYKSIINEINYVEYVYPPFLAKKRRLYYIPILYLDPLTEDVINKWKAIEKKWITYLNDYYYRDILVFPREPNSKTNISIDYKLLIRTENKKYIVSLLNKKDNSITKLFEIVGDIKKIKEIFNLWYNEKLLPDISYRFYEELKEIPKKFLRIKEEL